MKKRKWLILLRLIFTINSIIGILCAIMVIYLEMCGGKQNLLNIFESTLAITGTIVAIAAIMIYVLE